MKYILQFLFLYNVFCYLEIPIKYLPIYQSINSNPQDIYKYKTIRRIRNRHTKTKYRNPSRFLHE